ncbi:MAG: Tol-Pal system beta propeller repeat protein TolB [Acidobacteria bacterium]|nr:Tol-Pal system beta propeller repeat protein TolB [Acidobacteriota bacterium]MCZ6832836.1 Tol-Pal system beta propeller repeat protein TolB [Acidobacteriota bacterium]
MPRSPLSLVAGTLLLLLPALVPAQEGEQPPIELLIEGTGFQRIPLAVPEFPSVLPGEFTTSMAAEIQAVIRADLEFSGYFNLVDPSLHRLVGPFSERDVRFRQWQSIGANAVFLGKLGTRSSQVEVEGRLYNTDLQPGKTRGELIFGKRYRGEPNLARRIGHKLANDVVRSLTGAQGIFLGKIAFTSSLGPGHKEIFVMDYDGQRPVQITHNGAINLSPAWSPDGSQLAYVSFVSGRPEIHLVDAQGKRSRVFAREGDLNSAPEWAPDGKSMVYSVSREGNSELVRINLRSNRITRLTNHPAIETAPAFSPTGREIAFTSDRAGGPQIYIMDADGANVRRVTRRGTYNESAAWSPRGNLLTYCSRMAGQFEIVLMDLASGAARQLTRGGGNKENPRFSPDGMHLTFASNKTGIYQIYSMDLNGDNVRRLTRQGLSQTPDWSP